MFSAGFVQLLPQAFSSENQNQNQNQILLKLLNPVQLCKILLRGLSSIGIYFLLLVLFNMGDKVKSIIFWLGGGRDLDIMGGMRARAIRGIIRERERLRLAAVPIPIPAFVPGMHAVSSADRAAGIRAADDALKNAVRVAIAAEAYAAVMRSVTANLTINVPNLHPQPIPIPIPLNRARVAVDADADNDNDFNDDDDAAISDDGHAEEGEDDLASYIDGLIVTIRVFYEGLLDHPWDDTQMRCLDCIWIGFLKPVLLFIFKNTLLLISKSFIGCSIL